MYSIITKTAVYGSYVDWDSLHDHLRDAPQEDIFKLSASATATEFCEWVQGGIDVYILYYKYQVKPHSSPRVQHLPETWLSGHLVNCYSAQQKGIYYTSFISMAQRCCLLNLIKQNSLLKTFPRILIMMTLVSLYLFSLQELIWNCIIFL